MTHAVPGYGNGSPGYTGSLDASDSSFSILLCGITVGCSFSGTARSHFIQQHSTCTHLDRWMTAMSDAMLAIDAPMKMLNSLQSMWCIVIKKYSVLYNTIHTSQNKKIA